MCGLPTKTRHRATRRLNQALLRWVEAGQVPEKLMAERRDASGKVIRTRPLFPYPAVAKYRGTGNPDDAENFISTSQRK